MSDVVWQAIIAAIVAIYMEWSRRQTASKVKEVAVKQDIAVTKVEEVKNTLVVTQDQQHKELVTVLEKVEEVHRAANSMKDQLVLKTEKEALVRGTLEERARAEEQRRKKP